MTRGSGIAKSRRAALCGLLFFGLCLAAKLVVEQRYFVFYRGADPYIHLRLAALVHENGIIERLPQAEDIGWAVSFADKEFLFHAVLAAGHALRGEVGAVHAQYALIALFYATLAVALARLGGWQSLLFGALAALSTYYLQSRVFALRPQVLAMTAFLWVLLAVHSRRKRWIFISCALFALAYHALYIPLLVVVAAATVGALLREQGWRAPLLAGCGGLAAGAIAHPYFPGNLEIGLDALDILLQRVPTVDLVGLESRPKNVAAFARLFGPIVVMFLIAAGATALAVARSGLASTAREPSRFTQLVLLGVGAVTLGMLVVNPRSGEYFIPVAVLLVGLTFPSLARGRALVLSALLLPIGVNLVDAVPRYAHKQSVIPRAVGVERALRAIPRRPAALGEEGAKVFGCDWALGGFVFYFRPDLRFSDMNDPYLMHKAHPVKALAREVLNQDAVDRHRLLADHFDADYVLCGSRRLNRAFDTDPAFERLFPAERTESAPIHLFRIAESRPAEQVAGFTSRASSAAPARTWNSAFVHLRDEELTSLGDCITIDAEPAEVRRLAGGELLGLGGKAELRVELNDAVVARAQLSTSQTLERFVRLAEPLRVGDRLSLAACWGSEPDLSLWLSIWTREGYARHCAAGPPVPGWCEDPETFP